MEDSDRSLTNTTDISYGSKVLAKLEAGQSATLRCARKRMKADITVTAGVGGGGAVKRLSANAFATTLVYHKINLDMSVSANSGAVQLITARINLKRPIITTSIIVEES